MKLPTNIRAFFDKLGKFKVISIESRCYDNKLKLAGTCDAVIGCKGKRIAIDWKSSKSVQTKHKIQSGFYAKNNNCDLAWVVCFGSKNKQGFSVSKVDIDPAYKILELMRSIEVEEKKLTYKKN